MGLGQTKQGNENHHATKFFSRVRLGRALVGEKIRWEP